MPSRCSSNHGLTDLVGYTTQVYVDDGALGGFGKLEYHSPALDAEQGRNAMEDVSHVWAFQGPLETIDKICHLVLNL